MNVRKDIINRVNKYIVTKTFLLHRLLAIHFIPNPENKATVNHINGIKVDCRIENLEWNTQQENNAHAFTTGLNLNQHFKGKLGKDCKNSKQVQQFDMSGNLVKTWDSLKDAHRAGFKQSNISEVSSGKRNSHGGYKWHILE